MSHVLAALRGDEAPLHARVLEPPDALDGVPRPAAGPGAKSLYGGHLSNYIDTENFTIEWEDPDIDDAAPKLAATAMEMVWARDVVEDGWTQPVSSDRYLLWVVLDPTLSGTGFTTLYFTDEFPEGYPVIYLNPNWAHQVDFFTGLSYHEFQHALQYALRDYATEREAWYWEASAEWGSELVDPALDGSIYTVDWYSDDAWLAYDTVNSYHEYGMQVLNAWIDELGHGPGGMQAIWEASAGETRTWKEIIPETLGIPVADVWAGFSGSMGNNLFSNSTGYKDVALEPSFAEGVTSSAEELGTRYWRATRPAMVGATPSSGTVVVSGATSASADEIQVEEGEIVAVTATSVGGAAWTLTIRDVPLDTGDDETGGDSDDADDGTRFPSKDDPGCGCAASGPGASVGLVLLSGALLGATRRRG